MAHMEGNILRDDWCIDDVKSIAPWATNEEAFDVLASVANNHDATIGINWDVIGVWVDNICPMPNNYVDEDNENN